MAQLFSDPAINVTSLQGTDLFPILREILNSTNTVTGYSPQNIKTSDFAVAIVTLGLLQIGLTAPTSAPDGGGIWMNNGNFAFSSTATSTEIPMTAAAMAASLKALLAASPAMGAATNFEGFQNNAGVATEVDDGK